MNSAVPIQEVSPAARPSEESRSEDGSPPAKKTRLAQTNIDESGEACVQKECNSNLVLSSEGLESKNADINKPHQPDRNEVATKEDKDGEKEVGETVVNETPQEEEREKDSTNDHLERQESRDLSIKTIQDKTPKEISLIRKKKVALLMSYCGAGYFGMQKNPGVKTIEDELLLALSQSGAIKDEIKDDLGKMSFQRCARTDKGVSATRQVVSLKMVPVKELLPIINKHLPPSIRVFGMIRVTKGFDSKNQCSARTYQYLTPTFAFAPTEMQTVPSYRIRAPEIERMNNILKMLCGTHNFHNFTSGKHPDEASANRYIIDFKAGSPFVKKGHEFIALSVKGQSFMLHQIRKMIGVCIAICKGYCNEDIIERSWGKNKMDIPKAPGLGLMLDMVHFDRYNSRYGSDGMHETISWDNYNAEIDLFKETFIWDTIIESEITHKSMMKWLGTLKNHTYSENRIQGTGPAESES